MKNAGLDENIKYTLQTFSFTFKLTFVYCKIFANKRNTSFCKILKKRVFFQCKSIQMMYSLYVVLE